MAFGGAHMALGRRGVGGSGGQAGVPRGGGSRLGQCAGEVEIGGGRGLIQWWWWLGNQ